MYPTRIIASVISQLVFTGRMHGVKINWHGEGWDGRRLVLTRVMSGTVPVLAAVIPLQLSRLS